MVAISHWIETFLKLLPLSHIWTSSSTTKKSHTCWKCSMFFHIFHIKQSKCYLRFARIRGFELFRQREVGVCPPPLSSLWIASWKRRRGKSHFHTLWASSPPPLFPLSSHWKMPFLLLPHTSGRIMQEFSRKPWDSVKNMDLKNTFWSVNMLI